MKAKKAPLLRCSKKSRPPTIAPNVRAAAILLWEEIGRLGSLTTHSSLPEWITYHATITPSVKLQVLKISARTLERIIKPKRVQRQRKHNNGTKRWKKPKTLVPLRPLGTQITEVGHVEVDTVAHSGDSMSGLFAWTITITDILSGWTDTETVMGKDSVEVCRGLRIIEKRSFFRWKSIYVDNGTEFINEKVVSWFTNVGDRRESIPICRCRPYRKNDQAHVEQKNWTHVRSLWGYMRISYKPALIGMNSIAQNLWLPVQNGFIPQRKVVSKTRIGSKLIRTFDAPRTPLDRLLERPNHEVSLETKERLIQWKEGLNPFELRKKLRKRAGVIFRLLDASKEKPAKLCA